MRLFVKLNPVAELRAAGNGLAPDPAIAAAQCELAGADGITMHLSAERLALNLRDVQLVKEIFTGPTNLELAPSLKNRERALELRPYSVTLVDEPSEGQFDRWPLDESLKDSVTGFISALKDADIRAGVFIKPSIDALRWASRVDADIAVIDVGGLGLADSKKESISLFESLMDCARLGAKLNMEIHATGGIGYRNLDDFTCLSFSALHVGHALAARAMMLGYGNAVETMLNSIAKAAP